MVFESWNFKHVLSEPEGGEISWDTVNKTTMLPQPREKNTVHSDWIQGSFLKVTKIYSFFSVSPA